jgi:serine/threonine-protein kinase
MSDPVKVIARRPQTPVPGTRGSGAGGRLPDDLLSDQVRRLAVFAAVGAGLWSFGLLMDLVFLRVADSTFMPTVLVTTTELAGITAGIAMFLYVRHVPHAPTTKMDVGLAYMLVNAFGVGLVNAWSLLPQVVLPMYVSWNAVVILIFSMFAASSPRKMLVGAMMAASMDPLAVWLAHVNGIAVPKPFTVFLLFLPNYVCAAIAGVPALVLQRIGRRLREARELGSYKLVERLGQGGMGEVWRAEHRLLARDAAVKLVRPEVLGAASEDEIRTMLRRFEREARATAALNSPHTIHLYDFGAADDGRFYYVMELLTGRDLESLVRDFGPLPSDRAVHLLRQVCHSLADAHARGLVHRDIKPANIYACRMGLDYDFVKVLDFGLVKFGNRTSLQQTLQTLDHKTTGTPAYMAPEIILGEGEVDRRADVYAVGCVAYYLLTGELVFEAETPMKMMIQHVQAQPVPPSQRTELRIPRELDELVLACLRKDPNARPQDAGELFQLTCACRSCQTWDSEQARRWWEAHLPELTGPLTVGQARPDAAEHIGTMA